MEKEKKYLFGNFGFKKSKSGTDIYDATLKQLFIYELRNIYWVEKYLTGRLPDAAKTAYTKELKEIFERHFKITQIQTIRLVGVFNELIQKPVTTRCKTIELIARQGKTVIRKTKGRTAARDAGLILTWRKIEHYEIAAYGELAKLASSLRLNNISELLYMTLEEEMDEDADLMDIAENGVYSPFTAFHESHPADRPF